MRGELGASADVSAAVRAGVAAEPAAFPAAARKRGLRPVTGLAIAASVAAAAVLGLRLFLGGGDVLQSNETPVAAGGASQAPAPLAVSPGNIINVTERLPALQAAPANPGQGTGQFVVTPGPDATRLPPPGQGREARLNRYLVNHAGSMRSGVRGMVPYPVIVSHQER